MPHDFPSKLTQIVLSSTITIRFVIFTLRMGRYGRWRPYSVPITMIINAIHMWNEWIWGWSWNLGSEATSSEKRSTKTIYLIHNSIATIGEKFLVICRMSKFFFSHCKPGTVHPKTRPLSKRHTWKNYCWYIYIYVIHLVLYTLYS